MHTELESYCARENKIILGDLIQTSEIIDSKHRRRRLAPFNCSQHTLVWVKELLPNLPPALLLSVRGTTFDTITAPYHSQKRIAHIRTVTQKKMKTYVTVNSNVGRTAGER